MFSVMILNAHQPMYGLFQVEIIYLQISNKCFTELKNSKTNILAKSWILVNWSPLTVCWKNCQQLNETICNSMLIKISLTSLLSLHRNGPKGMVVLTLTPLCGSYMFARSQSHVCSSSKLTGTVICYCRLSRRIRTI